MSRDTSVSPGPTAFQLFSVELRQRKANWQLRLSPAEIARKVAEAWLKLTPGERQLYYSQAGVSKKVHVDAVDSVVTGDPHGKIGQSDGRDPRGQSVATGAADSMAPPVRPIVRYIIDSLGRRRPIRARAPPTDQGSATSASTPHTSRSARRRGR
jgi:hypothetical protein